jgi:coproporphyrinogen III oxidase-like Fe-S oxidoreductase
VKFVLEVTVDDGVEAQDRARELERILRYWGGNLRHYALGPGAGSAVYDSAYQEMGAWRVVAS